MKVYSLKLPSGETVYATANIEPEENPFWSKGIHVKSGAMHPYQVSFVEEKRHSILKRLVSRDGWHKILHRLQFLSHISHDAHTRAIAGADAKWVSAHYG